MSLSYDTTPVVADFTAFTNTLTIYKFDTANWNYVPEESVNANGTVEVVYHLKDSGMDYPVRLRIHSNFNKGETYCRVGIDGWNVISDSVTGLDAYEPISAFFGWKYKGRTVDDPFGILTMFKALLGTIIQDHATDKNTANAIRKLSDGNARILDSMYTDVVT